MTEAAVRIRSRARAVRGLIATGLLALAVLVPRSAGQGFEAGHLFVVSEGGQNVLQFNTKGNLVRTIGAALQAPQGLAFAPSGLLFVTARDAGRVSVFNPDGLLVAQLDMTASGSVPGAVAFGPDGAVAILDMAGNRVVLINDQGTVLDEVPLPEGDYSLSDLIFGPAGHLFAADVDDGRIVQVSLQGALVDVIGEAELSEPSGLALGPNGHLFVADGDSVHEFDAEGNLMQSLGGPSLGLSNARDLSFGASGHLFLSATTGVSDVVVELDLSGAIVRTFQAEGELSLPFAHAHAPYRFLTKVRGTVGRPGQGLTNLREKSAVLSIAPGSRTLMLAVTDDVTSFADLASVFNADAFVFQGFEAFEDEDANKRLYYGSQVPKGAFQEGIASINMRIAGKLSPGGRFQPKKAVGNLHRAGGTGVYNAIVVAGKLIK